MDTNPKRKRWTIPRLRFGLVSEFPASSIDLKRSLAMSTQGGPRLLEVEQVGEVTLVTITPRKILAEETTETIGAQLFSLVKELGCRKLVLNFGQVERLTSVMLGKVVMLHRK